MLNNRLKLGFAYVPIQKYTRTWPPAEGLSRGTIFRELYYPYVPVEKRADYGEDAEV